MTVATYNKSDGVFRCKGHSGFAPRGSDIVCAAVSSSVRILAIASEAEGIEARFFEAEVEIDIGKGSDSLGKTAEAVLKNLKLIAQEYPHFLKVIIL